VTYLKMKKSREAVEDFLRRVYENAYKEVARLRGTITLDMWAVYEMLGITEQTEQIYLKKAQERLREAWKRPTKELASILVVGPNNLVPFEILYKKYREEQKLKAKSDATKKVSNIDSGLRSAESGTVESHCGDSKSTVLSNESDRSDSSCGVPEASPEVGEPNPRHPITLSGSDQLSTEERA
jgi:hypothetical protein